MNNSPCSLCNHYANEKRLACARDESARFAWLEEQETKHHAECAVIRETWYLGLWINADKVIVVEEATK